MAALPYMQLYVADYLADTMHLNTEEHGAYLLLIFNYWQTGKPIPVSRLARIARLSNERWTDVERSLNEFFNERDNEWVHDRIERDLEAVHATQTQRIAAGKASAEARKQAAKARKPKAANARSTPVEISLNENPTNKEEKRRDKRYTTTLRAGRFRQSGQIQHESRLASLRKDIRRRADHERHGQPAVRRIATARIQVFLDRIP
ncbi:hypothetical protein ALQ55_01178 [Pseudomonas savastanoi pv. savastanoi]|uniref:DUF1376 domain-containing protein n=1 Tax=Pseudomonas savastanoi pv. savastanoi NCPPB 3335 TaxID=693985 RepID=A0ABC8BBI9_PSESS|nr:DUF1376 domain-containing protein [Pseudomonas savastanoi]ARD11389.1 hypothetical protein PSA3335_10115 [Pseudomonas savastanoi pv. savastanoi NCPPB 3335]RMN71244.1 hypothetical protein ALQ55_01178 [Pseudomonas savastanoi pv. savastanoi]